MKLNHLLLFGGIASIAVATPAQAVIQYQTVGPLSFTATDPNVQTPATIAFAPFTAAASTSLIDVRLSGGTPTSKPVLNFGGALGVGQFDATPRTYAATSTPSFKFNNPGASTFTGSLSNITLAGNPVTTPFAPISLAASGTYGGSFNMIMPSGVDKTYFSTGTPTITLYGGGFNATVPPGGGIFTNTLNLSSSNLYLTYSYDDGITAPVPGPLPIVGASMAFGFSRKLRRRIQSSAS
jgi:hypothetical protein